MATQLNNESRHANDEETQELRPDTVYLTRELETHGLFWPPMETPTYGLSRAVTMGGYSEIKRCKLMNDKSVKN